MTTSISSDVLEKKLKNEDRGPRRERKSKKQEENH